MSESSGGCGLQMNTDAILAFSEYKNCLFKKTLLPNE